MPTSRTSNPATTPVTVEDVRNLSRTTHTFEDNLIQAWIEEAVDHVESYQWSALITQTWQLKMDGFGDSRYVEHGVIVVPRPPLQSVSSITYVDGNGDTQTWSSSLYTVDTTSKPGRIEPAYGESYPTTRDQSNSVTVTYVAGYGAAGSSVPARIREAIRMYVAFRRENRQGEPMPEAINAMLDHHCFRGMAT